MITFLPYPQYTSSGIEWLGDIPEGWKIRKLKFIASIFYSNVDKHEKEDETQVRLCNYVDVYKNDYITDSLNFMEATASKEEIAKYSLKTGDILLTKDSEEWTDIAVPAYVTGEIHNVICGYHLALLRPNPDIYSQFLFRSLQSQIFNYQFQIAANGITRYGLGKQALGNAIFVIPSMEEQVAISEFLKNNITYIDEVIKTKHDQIRLLEQKKVAILTHAMTRGLNSKAVMKKIDSVVIEEIPSGWEVVKLKYISNIRYGLGQPPPEQEDGIPFIRATNVDSGHIRRENMLYVKETEITKSRNARLHKDEIIVVRSGAYAGDSAIIPEEYNGSIAGYDMVVRVRSGSSNFIAWQLLCPFIRDYQFGFAKMRAAQPHINSEELGNTLVLIPPTIEQMEISEYLDNETSEINNFIAIIKESIKLLEVQRRSLISAAVTGKIDVRKQEE